MSSELNELTGKVERLGVTQEHMANAVKDMAVSVTKLADKLDISDDLAKKAIMITTDHERRIKLIETRLWAVVLPVILALIAAVLKQVLV